MTRSDSHRLRMAASSPVKAVEAPVEAPAEAPVTKAPAKAQIEPQAIVVGIDPELFPKAPARQRREQKQKLLDHDAAAEQAMAAATS